MLLLGVQTLVLDTVHVVHLAAAHVMTDGLGVLQIVR